MPGVAAGEKLYRVQEVSWTVKDRKTARRLKKEGCMIIFENID